MLTDKHTCIIALGICNVYALQHMVIHARLQCFSSAACLRLASGETAGYTSIGRIRVKARLCWARPFQGLLACFCQLLDRSNRLQDFAAAICAGSAIQESLLNTTPEGARRILAHTIRQSCIL